MLRGLELLNSQELHEVARLIGLDEDVPAETYPTEILAWMCQQVRLGSSADPAKLERSVLEWVAKDWQVEHDPSIDTNDLERLLRRRMATEATEFLAPCWRVACALMIAEASAVADSKLEMLEKAARIVVPSTSVLEEHRRDWERLSREWQGEDPRPLLETDLVTLAQRPGLGLKALQLGLVIALADGRLSADEERLSRDLGVAMGMPEDEAIAVAADLNQLFWKHRNQLEEQHRADDMALAAANQALVESGALEGLANEARERLLSEQAEEEETSAGWSRLLGALSGLSQFFSARMDEETQACLARIVFLAIKKQRSEVERAQTLQAQAAKKKAAPPPPAQPALPPGAPVAPAFPSVAMINREKPAPKRSISLD